MLRWLSRLAAVLARAVFFGLVLRVVLLFVLGLNLRGREHLPVDGPAILAANHNSHLDAMVLMLLLPARLRRRTRAVAAADYFLSKRWLAWFATEVLGILPIARRREPGSEADPLAGCSAALERGDILVFFPEGTRGEPEQLSAFKPGIGRLATRHPEVPVVPVFMHGLGKALPRNEALLVPFNVDVFVGTPMLGAGRSAVQLTADLHQAIVALAADCPNRGWDQAESAEPLD